jgi:H+-transporting ATPase
VDERAASRPTKAEPRPSREQADSERAATRAGPSGEVTGAEGLSSAEAARRLQADGPNAIPEQRPSRLRQLLGEFWAPVPWLLEVAIVLEVVLGNDVEAAVFAALLAFNALLAFTQKQRAETAVALLRQRLSVTARVRRDRAWVQVPAAELVVGDLVHIRQGDLVPADLRLAAGHVTLDQAALTGESLPVSAAEGDSAFSGSVVARGEADGVVVATGPRTAFGRTAELVATARTPGHLERLIFGIVRALVALDLVLVAASLADGAARHLAWHELVPFALILVVASVPVALPATFTLATALGSRELASEGVLVTRLAAIEEAAAMEVLCTDKTGTITENRLAVAAVKAYPPSSDLDVLAAAAAASDEATQDPLDLAVLAAAADRGLAAAPRTSFVPFDPATKRSEAVVADARGQRRTVKGAPQVVAALAGADLEAVRRDVDELASQGARVLGVGEERDGSPVRLIGLVALADPPRPDSASLVAHLKQLGIRVVMATGDSLATARAIGRAVGITGRACLAEELRSEPAGASPDPRSEPPPGAEVSVCDIYAEVLPEDKLRLIDRLQRAGVTVGMTGDGVNDAPALRKAEVGIAVASATDVAKAAASLVLTDAGLENVVDGVQVSRRIHQRMLTYTLNKIVKTLQVALFLSLGLVVLGRFVTTPRLVVLLLLANDFVTMSLATDLVQPAPVPQRWSVAGLVESGLALAIPLVAASFGVWWYGADVAHLGTEGLETLVFAWLVASGQATVYLVRAPRRCFRSRPSAPLAASSAGGLALVALAAWQGWLMHPIPLSALGAVGAAAMAFLLLGDELKAAVFRATGVRPSGTGSTAGRAFEPGATVRPDPEGRRKASSVRRRSTELRSHREGAGERSK